MIEILKKLLEELLPFQPDPIYVPKPYPVMQSKDDNLRIAHEKLFGIGQPQMIEEALQIYNDEVDKNKNVLAMNALGQIYFEATMVSEEEKKHKKQLYDKAYQMFLESARLNNPQGWYKLGQMIEKKMIDDQFARDWDQNLNDIPVLQEKKKLKNSHDIKKVIFCLKQAAKQDHPDALNALGFYYENGYLNNSKEVENIQIYQAGQDKSQQFLLKPKHKKAEKYYKQGAQFKSITAMNNYARIILNDQRKHAEDLFKKSHNFGHAPATFNLGYLYEQDMNHHRGGSRSRQDVLNLYKLAADRGDINGKTFYNYYRLRDILQNEIGQTEIIENQDIQDVLLKIATNFYDIIQEDPNRIQALFCLGFMYEFGLGVTKDEISAYKYYQQATNNQGVSTAFKKLGDFNLTIFRENQTNLEARDEAIKNYNMAAGMKNRFAYLELGMIYDLGLSKDQDQHQKAKENYEKAIQYGSQEANLEIALLYEQQKIQDTDDQKLSKYYLQKALNGGNIYTSQLADVILENKDANPQVKPGPIFTNQSTYQSEYVMPQFQQLQQSEYQQNYTLQPQQSQNKPQQYKPLQHQQQVDENEYEDFDSNRITQQY